MRVALSLRLVLIGLGLSLASCGGFSSAPIQPPSSVVPPVNAGPLESGADFEPPPVLLVDETSGLSAQGLAPACAQPLSGGAYPYSTGGPSWRQWIYPNATVSAPYNYMTFSSDLALDSSNVVTAYTDLNGGQYYPAPFIYQQFQPKTLILSGVLEGTTTAVNQVYVSPAGSYGLVYRGDTKNYELPVNNTFVSGYKTFDSSGLIVKGADGKDKINPGNVWLSPTVNGRSIRLPGGQKTKFEFFLTNTVTFTKQSVLTNYKDPATGTTKNGWVVVNMPSQDGYFRITANRYTVGASTTPVLTNGIPIISKFTLYGFDNTADANTRMLFRKELWYRTPAGVATTTVQPLFDWLDARKDAALNWNTTDHSLGRATVSSTGALSGITDLSGLATWNLGVPSGTNANNCISKTVQVNADQSGFGMSTPKAVPPDPVSDPIPPDLTYGSPIALEFPVVTSNSTAYFDVYRLGDDAYSGKNFRWNFGDGTTATGDAVKHDYKTPGTYTVTLNYENAKGVTKEFKTQIASINIAKLVDKAANNENLTAKFDAGVEIPGLTYEYTVEDKGGQTATMSGSKASHTYAGVGTFDYTLTVRDNRASLFGTPALNTGRLQAQAIEPNRVIFKRTAWNVFWQRAPIADISWIGSDLAGAPLSTIRPGLASTTVQFNAGLTRDDPRNFGSFDSELKYEWNFGDGTTSVERNPTKVYNQTKPFLVTMTVTNKYGLKDTKKLFYHIRDFQYDTTLRTEYPNGTTTRTSVDPPLISAQSVFVSSPSPTDADTEAYLPWVLPNMHNIIRGVHYPIKTTGERTFSLCNEYKLFVNGAERYPQYVEQGGTVPDVTILDPFLPPVTAQFCDAMVMGPGNIAAVRRSSWNVIEILSSRGSTRISVNTFHHLNVPRVMVSVLPDELIPGEQASPVVTQWHAFNDDTKVEELVVSVKIRQSELPSGNIKFKVPVYAVDITGKRQKTVDGAMYARFRDYVDDNDPVIFVDGVAEMPVSLNGFLFGPEAQEIDLTNIQYASSNGDCGLGDGPLARAAKATVSGCSTDKAVYAYPTANAPVSVPQLPEFYQKSRPFFGHVLYGKTSKEAADEIRTILDQHKRNTLEGIDFIVPILWNEHRKEYLDLINRGNAKGFFTLGERLQLAAMGIGLVADALPVVHTGLKVAGKLIDGVQIWIKGVTPGSKAVIKAADEALSPAATAGKLPEEAATLIPPKLGVNTNKLLNDCNSQICFDAYDDLMDTIKASGRTEAEARALADQAIKEVDDWTAVNGYTHLPNEKLHNADLLTACKLLPNSFAPDTLVQTMSGLQRIDQIKVGVLVAGFDEQTQSEGYYPVTALHQNYDSETTVLALATGGGQQEQVTTTPNHPFYTSNGKWVEAGKLTAGDQLQRTGKAVGRVVNVTTTAGTAQMFNLTVEQAHTFFVGTGGWLVHNADKTCLPFSTRRAPGSMLTNPALPDIKSAAPGRRASPDTAADIARARIREPQLPYSVEEGARVTALRVQAMIDLGMSNKAISKPMHGIVVNVRAGDEVSSSSSMRTLTEETDADLLRTNRLAADPASTTKVGACSEPQGCALLLGNPPKTFIPNEYATYAYWVDVKDVIVNGIAVKRVVITPHARCKGICSRLEYLASPTDKFDSLIEYEFNLTSLVK
jgi:Pretoxin HINT domain/PKD domain